MTIARKETQAVEEHVYKVVEVVGSSEDGLDGAIRTAISRASQSLKNLRWFEVTQMRGHIEDGKIKHFQATLKIGFTLEEDA
jgi:flavin-binding protein dodecin